MPVRSWTARPIMVPVNPRQYSSDSFPASNTGPTDRQFFSSLDILRQATSNGGKALRMSGKLYPYPGDLGVIKEGAMADMLIVKDNPLDDVTILSNYDEQLLLIVKDGKIYKNTLQNGDSVEGYRLCV